MCFPSGIVATGIRVVELESPDLVITSIHHSDTERSARSELGIKMLFVADELDEFLDVDILVVRVQMPLAVNSGVVNQIVCVSHNARNSGQNVIVNFVKFA